MSDDIRDQLVRRLLAIMRGDDCTCSETTCRPCIAKLIAAGDFERADIALSRLEQVITEAT